MFGTVSDNENVAPMMDGAKELPNMVVTPPEPDIKSSAIDVKFVTPPKCFDLLFIVCHEAVQEMRVGPSESACRSGLQTA